MQTAINVNPSQISLNADDIRIKDAGGIITANDVEGALQENRLKLNAHIAGTADKHAADKINYSGNVTGVSDVKAAIDRLQTNINNISMTGSQHDALVTAALIDVENENFNTAEKGYLNGRLEKWEQRTKAIENDIQEGKTAELIIDGGIGTLPETAAEGQVSVTVKGVTRTNLASGEFTGTYQTISISPNKLYHVSVENFLNATSWRWRMKFYKNNVDITNTVSLSNIKGIILYLHPSGYLMETDNRTTKEFYFSNIDADRINIQIALGDTTSETISVKAIVEEGVTERGSYISYGTKSTLSGRIKRVGKNKITGQTLLKNYLTGLIDINGVIVDSSQVQRVEPYLNGFRIFSSNNNRGLISDFIEVKQGVSWTIGAKTDKNVETRIYVATYDENKNYIDKIYINNLLSSFTPSTSAKYFRIQFSCYLASNSPLAFYDIFLIEGTDGEYEPYKESITYITLPSGEELRSLPSGAYDEVSLSEGKHTKRVSDPVSVSGTMFASLDTTTYVNVDVVKTTAFSDAMAGTTSKDGLTRLYDKNGVELTEVAQTDIDNTASIGKYYWHTDKTLWIIVAKGAYADITAARTALGTMTLNYQLAQPIETNVPAQMLTGGPNHTIMWLPHKKDKGLYTETGFIISDQSLPIKSLISVKKKDLATGQDVDIDLSTCTVAGDGLSFTSSALVEGDSTVCVYEYDDSLGTKPQIVVKYNNDFKAQVNSNTDAIQRNNKAILNMQDRLDLMYADLDFRLTILELSGGGEE